MSRVLDAQPRRHAAELQAVVAHERAGQQVRLAQDLEAVADADDGLPGSAWRVTASITGENRAIAPVRRWSPYENPPGITTAS